MEKIKTNTENIYILKLIYSKGIISKITGASFLKNISSLVKTEWLTLRKYFDLKIRTDIMFDNEAQLIVRHYHDVKNKASGKSDENYWNEFRIKKARSIVRRQVVKEDSKKIICQLNNWI